MSKDLANVLVDVSFTLDLPESVVDSIIDPEDHEDREEQLETIERAVAEEPFRWADHMTAGACETEADG